MIRRARPLASAMAILACSAATAQQAPPTPPATAPAPDAPAAENAPATAPDASTHGPPAATVNGEVIYRHEVDEVFDEALNRQSRGQPVAPQLRDQLKKQWAPQILEVIIEDRLLDQSAEKAGIAITGDDVEKAIQDNLDGYRIRNGLSDDELLERVKESTGLTVPEFIAKQSTEPQFRRSVAHRFLIEKAFPAEMTISDAQIQARYDRDKKSFYSHPERVRASHILIKADPSATKEQKSAARVRAEAIRKEAAKPDADFAELARTNSEGPSAPQGGDLGYFPRHDAMVEPFAAAAFELKVGQVSDIVETQFGFHIIKVTQRKKAYEVPLEVAAPIIRAELKSEKLTELRKRYVDDLRKSAKIEYSDPATAPDAHTDAK